MYRLLILILNVINKKLFIFILYKMLEYFRIKLHINIEIKKIKKFINTVFSQF